MKTQLHELAANKGKYGLLWKWVSGEVCCLWLRPCLLGAIAWNCSSVENCETWAIRKGQPGLAPFCISGGLR